MLESGEVLWVIARAKSGAGIAMRAAYAPDGVLKIDKPKAQGRVITFRVVGNKMGVPAVDLETFDDELALIRVGARITPTVDLLVPQQPWNIYPIDAAGNPLVTEGIVHAAQRGSAAGLLYFSVAKPVVGSVLYFQNLTALNGFGEQMHTTPNTVVGDSWPGLGFRLPPSDTHVSEKGKPCGISDAYVRLAAEVQASPQASARLFLKMLADVYVRLPRPETAYRDWQKMAATTLHDLSHSPKCRVEEHGYLYLHPYTASEYPDSMVPLAVLLPLMEYADWTGKKTRLIDRLREAVPNFFDPQLGTIRRYLSTVGADKEALEVESWYLYHPLLNLARLARKGDTQARDLLLKSAEFGIQIAQHFKYVWPVQFHLKTMEVITLTRQEGEAGQTDVPGIYAVVMLDAYELTNDPWYLEEATKAIDSLRELAFTIGYQFNIVAIGALACHRPWKLTGNDAHRAQGDVLLASFFHNTNIWECDFGPAKHFSTFLGVMCLHDGAYMAAYEEFEAFATFHDCLRLCGDELSRPVRLLLTEYCRFALHRSWFDYPSELPADQLSEEVRNGHVDRTLALPLEDLYADWQKPGAVGQEIYGAGMAFSLLTRSHHRLKGVPFLLYCDYPFRDVPVSAGAVACQAVGEADFTARLRIIPTGRSERRVRVTSDGSPAPRPRQRGARRSMKSAAGQSSRSVGASKSKHPMRERFTFGCRPHEAANGREENGTL